MAIAYRPAARSMAARGMAGAFLIAASATQATPLALVYTGTFNTDEALNPASAGTPTRFAATTPFTIRALFDDSTPNLAPPLGGPFDGFRAYAPSSVTIAVGAATYGVETIVNNTVTGVAVAVFDRNSFDPGHYAVGLFADPVHDGAGIVGDFTSASPDFTAAALTPTVFMGFFGVGHASGVCLSGNAPNCLHAITPWVLYDSSGAAWNLTLANFEADYPVAHTPGAPLTALDTAQITAVPEPGSAALVLTSLLALGVATGRKSGLPRRFTA